MNNDLTTQDGLFGPIGLSLSGGGYRAAGFHLGTLDYLNRVQLLSSVQILSTVSGGTFTGMSYVLSRQQKIPFEAYFHNYYKFLRDTDLVKRALDTLGKGKAQAPSGRQDLIVSIAQVYAETFLKDEDDRPIRFGRILDSDLSPLGEVVFNATEFQHGIAFRFQKSSTGGKIGNGYLSITSEEAAQLRLADIAAASSCFPGGFEPLAFPDDFTWPDGKIPDTIRKKFPQPFALMDGGVYDNQGLESMLLADGREAYDLGAAIVSDVSQKCDNLYTLPKPKESRLLDRLTLKAVNRISLLTIAICVLTIGVVGYNWYQHWGSLWNFFLYCIPLVLALGTAGILWTLWSLINKEILNEIPQVKHAAWNDIKELTLGQIVDMLNLRATSLLAMTSDIFMKRVRSLVYAMFYQDKKWENKRISNMIYHLKTGEKFEPLPKEVHPPSQRLQEVVDRAADMKTTLWFETPEQLDDLVACGHATMCYNLMKFIDRRKQSDPQTYTQEVAILWEKLVEDWRYLNKNPMEFIRKPK
jgi:hypothetical protein